MELPAVRLLGDPILRTAALPVQGDHWLAIPSLVEVMYLVMDREHGIGLAANQIGSTHALFVLKTDSEKEAFINPEILTMSGATEYEEGCLSIPGVIAKTQRFSELTLKYQKLDKSEVTATYSGAKAIAIQHEMDHLNGKLYVDPVWSSEAQDDHRQTQEVYQTKSEGKMKMLLMLTYLSGVFTGASLVLLYGILQMKKRIAFRKKAYDDFGKELKQLEDEQKAVGSRLQQVQQLTKEQFDLLAAIDQPSKNALHSKYKNDLNARVRELEEEKAKILASILKDGHNPKVSVLNADTNVKESILLSEYMKRSGMDVNTNPPPPPAAPGDPAAPKKVGKFMVYSGGNDDTTH
jgi:peptide deformylase